MGPVLIEPEHSGRVSGPRAGNCQLYPVANRDVLGLAGAPDISGGNLVGDEDVAGLVDNLDFSIRFDLEGLVMAAVLFGGLRHQAHIGHGPDRGRVQCTVLARIIDRGLVDTGVRAVGNYGERVGRGTVRAPHLAAAAYHGGHGRVDNHVGGHVQVGDPTVGIDHGHGGTLSQCLFEGSLNFAAVFEPV